MMLGLKNPPLFFLGVSLAILPAFVYGIPINLVDLPAVPQLDLSGKPLLVVPKVPLETTLLKDPLLLVPTKLIPTIDDDLVPTKIEKLEKVVLQQQLPLLPVESSPLIDNTNLLLEKLEEVVTETVQPVVVLASIVHVDNVQVLIAGKLLEKILTKEPLSLVIVESKPQPIVGLPGKLDGIVPEQLSLRLLDFLPQDNNVNVLSGKLNEVVGEILHPLVVIASIPQIGNIQLVFSEELLSKLLSKKAIYLVPVESQPEVGDGTILLIKEEIIPEKPLLLVPGKSQVPFSVVASIPYIGNVQFIFSGELLDQILLKKSLLLVDVQPKPLHSGVTLSPGLLEKAATENLLLLDPVELTPFEKVGLETHKPLDFVTSISQLDNVPVVLSEELLDKIPSKKPLLLSPVESHTQAAKVVVVPEVVKGTLEDKPFSLVPILKGHSGDVLISDVLTSNVVTEASTLLPTSTPVLEISTHGKLSVETNDLLLN